MYTKLPTSALTPSPGAKVTSMIWASFPLSEKGKTSSWRARSLLIWVLSICFPTCSQSGVFCCTISSAVGCLDAKPLLTTCNDGDAPRLEVGVVIVALESRLILRSKKKKKKKGKYSRAPWSVPLLKASRHITHRKQH